LSLRVVSSCSSGSGLHYKICLAVRIQHSEWIGYAWIPAGTLLIGVPGTPVSLQSATMIIAGLLPAALTARFLFL